MLNEGEETRSPNRKVFGWNPKKKNTGLVREAKSTEHDEEEERTFIPSAERSAEALVSL